MPITIPERLQQKLHTDSVYEGYINTLLQNTKPLITEKADFFPEYTLHGWTHIQAVLHHADKLIPEETMEVLAGRDAALLIAAVILHDLGMFLEVAGVRKLLTGSRSTRKTNHLDKHDWKFEWDRYIQEIRRYPEEKLLYHFGMSRAIEEPDVEKGNYSDLDRLIVGDFLRRHHQRIAHEIALETMPGDTDVDVLQVGMDASGNKAFTMKDRKCIGILARSHGMTIRETREYINRELGRLHVEKLTYLMAVLRLADALDADERRAPDTQRKLVGIRTPVSVKEWSWNQRISRTDLDWDSGADYKYVEAEPESTTEFVHLEKWLNWVQKELDTSWAVLSEVCDTQKYRLSIHRIESNILEPERRESYGEKFITRDARLNANPELLKLLVAPLYDNDPSCGVRELLQNAVDACNERKHLEGEGYRGQVEIRLDTEARTLTVTDNGIGMDENVLLNYYLSAGASYRTSDQWFQNYATDRNPNIVRTGRFGVGVLATFLLGNLVEVTTRHMDDERGYTFEFGLEPKGLDIRRPDSAPEVGTTIKVTLKDDALEKMLLDCAHKKTWLKWYRFEEPSVCYRINGIEYVGNMQAIPRDERDCPGWFTLLGTEYEMVRWGYPPDGIFCNGIRIPGGVDHTGEAGKRDEYFGFPSVSILDRKGKLLLDLSRRKLLHFPEEKVLLQEARRYAMSQLLMADWSSEEKSIERFGGGIWYFRQSMGNNLPIVCAAEGYTLPEMASFFSKNDFAVLEFTVGLESAWEKVPSMLRCMKPTLPLFITLSNDKPNLQGLNSQRLQSSIYYLSAGFQMPVIERVWSEMQQDDSMVQPSQVAFEEMILRTITGNVIDNPKSVENNVQEKVPFCMDEWDTQVFPLVTELRIKGNCVSVADNTANSDRFFVNFVQTYMDSDPWIPYDMEERRKKFPRAFEELKYYIDRILADREKERGGT